MIKKTFTLMALLLATVSMLAAPVGKEQARQKAAAFALKNGQTVSLAANAVHKAPTQNAQGNTPYYVFDLAGGQGFVVVSGDDRTVDILGYTDSGCYDDGDMPDNMRAWLAGYADIINSLDDAPTATTPAPMATAPTDAVPMAMTAISPLLTCTWNQGAPYSNDCPVINNTRCPTGCVATSMVQVMYFHKWPQAATTAIPANTFTYNGTSYTQDAQPAVVFDWNSMKDSYSGSDTSAGATAVATLMRYAGQSIKSGYSPSGTGAGFTEVHNALLNYYDYDKNIKHLYRSDYTIDGWANVVYNELANRRPVMYAGTSSGGAHAFVCDGYDGNGLFHINWGWGGWRNGYFKLSILNPDDNSGIGASTSHDGYAMGQDILVGVQPPTGDEADPEVIKMNLTQLQANGTKIVHDSWNTSGATRSFNIGLAILNDDLSIQSVISSTIWNANNLNNYTGYTGHEYEMKGKLSAGTYKIQPVSRVSGTTTWYGSGLSYVEVVVDDSGNVTLTKHPIENITGCDIYLPSAHKVNETQHVQITVTNGGDEYYGQVYLFASTTSTKGSNQCRTALVVPEGGQETLTLYFTPSEAGIYNIWIALDDSGSKVIGQTMVEIGESESTAKYPVATFYADINYGGTAVGLPEGRHTLSSMQGYGIKNDDISSLKVTNGYKVTLYQDDNFGGGSKTWTSDASFVGNDWNDQASSIAIEPNGLSGMAGRYRIKNHNSQLYLDLADDKVDVSTEAIQNGEQEELCQLWDLAEVDNGAYTIRPVADNLKALSTANGDGENGTPIVLNHYLNASYQQFILIDKGNGTYQLLARHCGRAMEIPSSAKTAGTTATIYNNNGSDTQLWELEPVDDDYIQDLTDNGGNVAGSHSPINDSESVGHAIDNNNSTKYCARITAGQQVWLTYHSTSPAKIVSYSLTSANDAPERDPKTWKLQGSNDGGLTWEDIDQQSGETFADRYERHSYTVASDKSYSDFRLLVTELYSSSATIFQIAEWQLFGIAGPATAIDQPALGVPTKQAGFYTLQGVKVAQPTRPGIYIRDGKKVVIK